MANKVNGKARAKAKPNMPMAGATTLPVVDTSKLSAEELAAFDAVDMGKGTLSQAQLLSHRLPEMPAKLVPIIEQIWLSEVVGK